MFLTIMYDLYRQMFNSWKKFDTIGWGNTDCNYAPAWIFLPLDIIFDYRIAHVALGLLYIILEYSIVEFHDLQLIVLVVFWCRRLTTCGLYVSPFLRTLIWNDSWFWSFT